LPGSSFISSNQCGSPFIARPTCQRLIPLSPLTQSRQLTTSLSLARTDLTAVNSSSANQPRSRYHHQHQYHHSRWHATQASQIIPSFSLLLRSMFSFPTALLSSPKANYNLIDGPKSPCQTGTTSSWLQIHVYRTNTSKIQMPAVRPIQDPCKLLEQGDQGLPA
jgi:hypothetical protein